MAFLPKCSQVSSCPDCMLRTDNGMCKALSDTLFFKKCPFYKTKQDDPETYYKLKDIEKYENKQGE